jgi:hypothetical protein
MRGFDSRGECLVHSVNANSNRTYWEHSEIR